MTGSYFVSVVHRLLTVIVNGPYAVQTVGLTEYVRLRSNGKEGDTERTYSQVRKRVCLYACFVMVLEALEEACFRRGSYILLLTIKIQVVLAAWVLCSAFDFPCFKKIGRSNCGARPISLRGTIFKDETCRTPIV